MLRSEKIGVDGFLLKPVSQSVLFDAIMVAFGKEVPEREREARARTDAAQELAKIRGAKVLLAEDNAINQQVAQEILENAGLVVSIANNGKEAVEMVKERIFDAVLMDIQMPEMNGFEATRKIRQWESVSANADTEIIETQNVNGDNPKLKPAIRNPEISSSYRSKRKKNPEELSAFSLQPSARAERVPIIAMTAHAMAGDRERSLEAGMNDHVTKPIDPDQLFAALQKWIKPVAERTVVQKSLPASEGPAVRGAPAESDQAQPVAEEELPESLPGFDLAAGLERLMGNKRLYRKLLLDFGVNYGRAAAEIRAALAAKDFNQGTQPGSQPERAGRQSGRRRIAGSRSRNGKIFERSGRGGGLR